MADPSVVKRIAVPEETCGTIRKPLLRSPRTLPLPVTIAAVTASFVLGYLLRPSSDSLAGTISSH